MSGTPSTPQQTADRVGEGMLRNDRATRTLGMAVLAMAPGAATLSMRVREDMLNGHDTCHGGFIACCIEVSKRGRTGVYDTEVTNQRGERIAVFRGRSHTMKGRPAVSANDAAFAGRANP